MSHIVLTNGRDTSSGADPQYINMRAAESGFAYNYAMSIPQPVNPRAHPLGPIWNENKSGVPRCAIDVSSRLRGEFYRVRTLSAHVHPTGGLPGSRAPYTMLGRGELYNTDVSTMLRNKAFQDRSTAKAKIAETRWAQSGFAEVPAPLRNLDGQTLRKGEVTRVAPEWMQPHDPLQPFEMVTLR